MAYADSQERAWRYFRRSDLGRDLFALRYGWVSDHASTRPWVWFLLMQAW